MAVMTEDEKKQLDRNTEMTVEIHSAVVGNANLGHVGLVGQVKRAHERLDEHEVEDRDSFNAVKEAIGKIDSKVSKIFAGLAGIMVALKIYEALSAHFAK